jgi:hypothetical protein
VQRTVILGLLATSIMSSLRAQTEVERRLEWVESTTPAIMLADSTRAGHFHFLTVCGFACEEPGIGALTYFHCYAGAATKLTVDPTGDVIRSQRHGQLKGEMYRFAQHYNILLRAQLDSAGKRTCPASERWDDYWHAIDSVAHRIPAHPYESFVIASAADTNDRGEVRGDFQLHVQDEHDLSNATYFKVCALAPRYGITGRVRFDVTTGNINDHPKRHPSFVCLRGTVAA